jgi:DNA polymerase V
MLSDLRPAVLAQGSLLAAVDPDRSQNLMATLDAINQRWGRGTLKTAAEGVTQPWQMKRQRLSPRYTTDWAGLPPVLAR